MRSIVAVVAIIALAAGLGCGDNSRSSTSPTSTSIAPPPPPPPPPQPPRIVEVLTVRRVNSSRSYWRVNGTIRNKTRRTINRLSEVRIDVFDASGLLIHEDRDLFGEDIPDEQQKTFSILIPKSDTTQASSYTLEVTNYMNGSDVVQECSGCGSRPW